MATVVPLETPELGDRSYLVHDGELAAAIDPQRDLDRVRGAAADHGVRIVLVAETHLHNDYVTGGLELARRTGSPYAVGGGEEATFDCRAVTDGDVLEVGALALRVVATPGHTEAHVAYVLEAGGRPQAVFTGGSLLYGTVGRTDLVAPDRTAELTRRQHRSVRQLAASLPGDAAVHPTHGFGSFCTGSVSSSPTGSTIQVERAANLALAVDDPEDFTAQLLGGLTAYPAYSAHMGLVNRAGPAVLDLTPPAIVDGAELGRRVAAGEWVVDLRPRRAFAAAHRAGMVGAELTEPFTTYLGWVLPWGMPVTLVAEDPTTIGAAQRNLARIGIDRPVGMAVGSPASLGGELRAYPVRAFADLAAARSGGPGPVVVDVRRDDEWSRGHLPQALHLPLPELVERADELPRRELWVHCAGGYRASLASSLLDRAGHRVILIDDDWDQAAAAGLEVIPDA